MRDYTAMMAPDRFTFVPDVVQRERGSQYHEWFEYAIDLHGIVAGNVDYARSGRSVPEPDDMLDRLHGDCEDQSVLLGTLYQACGLSFRFVRVQKGNSNAHHILIELRCPVPDVDLVWRLIKDYYADVYDRSIGRISWERDDGAAWFVADPVWSDYVGDAESLRNSAYVSRSDDDGWEWYNVKSYRYP